MNPFMGKVNSTNNVRNTIYAVAFNQDLECFIFQTQAFYESGMILGFHPVFSEIRNAIDEYVSLQKTNRPAR